MGTRRMKWQIAALSVVAGLGAVSAQAALIGGSAGSVVLVGDDGNPSGSFSVQVDYSVYDGLSAGDPLGITPGLQLVFQMTHLGTGGESPVLNVGRLTVFGPVVNDPVPFYTSIASLHQVGQVTPSTMDIDPPPVSPSIVNRGEFFFEDFLTNPLFAPGDVSDRLVLTTARGNLPADVVIEVNHTQPQVHADTIIRLVPEPTAMSLLALGAVVALRRRSK